jgi:uncharacterized protein YjbI with pentapeptide repeats
LNLRFTSASDQLGASSAAVRLAGAYAMASLADDWIEQTQTCVNVLCAYLRMEIGSDASEPRVRGAILAAIRERTRADGASSWSTLDYDMSGAILDDLDFSDCVFKGHRLVFSGAEFTGMLTTFEGARFESGQTVFNGCTFEAKTTRFNHCTIASREAWLEGLQIHGRAWFDYLTTTGEVISFSNSNIVAERFSMLGSNFSSKEVIFEKIQFKGERVSFSRCIFSGATSFRGCTFGGHEVWFDRTQFIGPSADFEGIKLDSVTFSLSGAGTSTDCVLSAGPLTFPPITLAM